MAREKICGVYLIQSKVKPDRVYVGSSFDIKRRFGLHVSKLRCHKHHTPKLQCHTNKYGIDDLMFFIIEVCNNATTDYLISREQYYIDTIKPWFNTKMIANSPRGMRLSEDARRKISEARKGVPLSERHKESLRRAWKSRRINYPMSQEFLDRLRVASMGKKPWNTGLTKETDERLALKAEKSRGRVPSADERERISSALKGRPHSKEHNKKVGDALRGKKQSPEVVDAKRKRAKEWWDEKRRKSIVNSES